MLTKFALIICFFLIIPFVVLGQQKISGIVLDQISGKPIENASIYFNETQIGTKTDNKGLFSLNKDIRFSELVISCIGYQKIKITEYTNDSLKILLSPIENALNEITITRENHGWDKWGALFTKLLMSDDSNDYFSSKYKDQVVLNPGVINFNFNKKSEILTASSSEPILVINDKLGYLIKVDLDEFEYDIKTEFFKYQSTLFFEPTASSQTIQQIQQTTNKVYYGSATHFLSALMKNNLKEEGFEIYKYTEIKDNEKARVIDQINKLKNIHLKQNNFSMDLYLNDFIKNRDTLKHYQNKLSHKDYLSRKLVPISLESILKFDEQQKVYKLQFKDSILVTYNQGNAKNKIHTKYANTKSSSSSRKIVETIIYQTNADPIVINYGSDAINFNLFMVGYMSGKRLAASLPNDFDPSIPRVKVAYDALEKLRVVRDENP